MYNTCPIPQFIKICHSITQLYAYKGNMISYYYYVVYNITIIF